VRTQLNRLVGGMRIFPAEITGTQAGGAPEDGRPDADHRGAITDPVRPPPIATHADDVHRLPAQVAESRRRCPAAAWAPPSDCTWPSTPERPRALTAHQPIGPWRLAAAERARHIAGTGGVQDTHRTAGRRRSRRCPQRTIV
jgi:hypothetical protein